MIEANLQAYAVRYADLPRDFSAEKVTESYRHRRNDKVAALWEPRRFATYRTAISSLDYQCHETTTWPDTDMGQLLDDVKSSLAFTIDRGLSCEGAWLWPSVDRGRLPHTRSPGRPVSRWAPPLEVVTIAEDGGGGLEGEARIFLGGEEVHASVLDVDAGAGWYWPDWCRHRDETLAVASPAARAVLEAAFADPPGGAHVTGRGKAGWLDPTPDTEEGHDAAAAS